MTAAPRRRTAADVLPDLAAIVHAVTGRPVEEVRPDRSFVDDLGVDSLAMVEIIEAAAQHFAVTVDDEDSRRFVRVVDLADHLARRLRP